LLSFSIQTVILAFTNLNFDLHHQSRTPLQTREALKITNLTLPQIMCSLGKAPRASRFSLLGQKCPVGWLSGIAQVITRFTLY